MEFKTAGFANLETRASGDDWEIAGMASVFSAADAPVSAADSYGDLVLPGAFARSLASGRRVKLLWQHDVAEPIGLPVELRETPAGLYGRWKIPKTQTGAKARELVAAGLVDGLSIGFVTEEEEYRKDGVRLLRAVSLHEVSAVTLPAQESATIESWKARHRGERLLPVTPEQLRRLRRMRLRILMRELGRTA